MKRQQSFLTIIFLLTTALFPACQNEKSVSPQAAINYSSARYDLEPVTVTANRLSSYAFEDFKIDVFTQDHSFQFAFSPYRRIREYAGDDDLDNLPGFLQRLLDGLNAALGARNMRAFNPAEMAILRTLTVQQVISYFTYIIAADDISDKALAETFRNTAEDNGFANAFRHVYLSYITTKNFGFALANDLLNAHEEGQGGTNSSIMDDNNNAIGKGIANGCCPGTNLSDASIAYQTLVNMAINGQLWTLQDAGNPNSALGQFPYVPPTNSGPTQGIP